MIESVEQVAGLDEHVRVREVRGDLFCGQGPHDGPGKIDVLAELLLRSTTRSVVVAPPKEKPEQDWPKDWINVMYTTKYLHLWIYRGSQGPASTHTLWA